VAQQKASGAFMTITSPVAGRLVSASSPVAGVTEIHEMTMDGQVMRMRAVDGLDLPAGRAVQLKPGGYHVMLMELRQPLKAGETVPITLVIERAGGAKESVRVAAPVRPLAASAAPMEHKHDHKH
jgi:copper(I)-binding protein